MAKSTATKSESKTTKPKAEAKPAAKAKAKESPAAAPADLLEQASEEALKKLKALGIDPQLQSELEWCLGSYRFDRNPSGLITASGRALIVLNEEKARKTKGVTAKLIADLEKALKIQ